MIIRSDLASDKDQESGALFGAYSRVNVMGLIYLDQIGVAELLFCLTIDDASVVAGSSPSRQANEKDSSPFDEQVAMKPFQP